MGGDDKTDIEKLAEKAYDVTDFYVESGPVVRLCTSSKFENTTFGVIGINALYMGIDSDNNNADMIDTAHITFQLCESLFCIYFTFELTVRFMSFKLKRNCFRDGCNKIHDGRKQIISIIMSQDSTRTGNEQHES